MSYYISEGTSGTPLKLSTCQFFMDHFVDKTSGKNQVFLNQIIGFDRDIDIDIPLEVVEGGIIFSQGTIKVSAPSPTLSSPTRDDPRAHSAISPWSPAPASS